MVSNSTKVEMWREYTPSSYSLRISRFSLFQKTTPSSDHKYTSSCFASCGYNWRLIVYPKGNEKDEGNGFISMYVEIDNESLMTIPSKELYAYLTFSIYNQKQKNYFLIHDFEAKRFNTLKTIWGFPQVISLDTFTNLENGYIFNGGICELGVDVFVAPPPTNYESLSVTDKFYNPKFCWTVKNFSELQQESYESESFLMGAVDWVLKLYPKGDSLGDGKSLSIFLCLADSEAQNLKEDQKIYSQTQLRLLYPFGNNHLSLDFSGWHGKSNTGLGHRNFVSIDQVKKMYLDQEDSLKLEIEFEVASLTSYSISN